MTEARCMQLDVGNSSGKWRLLNGTAVVSRGRLTPGDATERASFLASAETLDAACIASVAADAADQALAELLRERWGVEPWFAVTPARSGELRNSYSEPEKMGVDRWLAMLAARARRTARLCVVDAGSALTIDLVAANGQHEGGYIIPGPALMARSLQTDTQRVRYAAREDISLDAGKDTASAVGNGIALAQCGAVELALQRCSGEVPELFLTGGGATALQRLLQRPATLVEDLVFEGLTIMYAGRERGNVS